MSKDEKNRPKGFAGLEDLASDITDNKPATPPSSQPLSSLSSEGLPPKDGYRAAEPHPPRQSNIASRSTSTAAATGKSDTSAPTAAVRHSSTLPPSSTGVHVTVKTFDDDVIEASQRIPVLVDFRTSSGVSCKILSPMLDQLESIYSNRFRVVKVDVDKEKELGVAFGIRSIPTCVLIVKGKPVDGFMGMLPENKIKEFLNKHLPVAG